MGAEWCIQCEYWPGSRYYSCRKTCEKPAYLYLPCCAAYKRKESNHDQGEMGGNQADNRREEIEEHVDMP